MQIIISPAKTMAAKSKIGLSESSIPRFQALASEIALAMTQYDIDELMNMLPVSRKLAIEAHERYQQFHSPDYKALQSILSYTGVVFRHIKPSDFTPEDFAFANSCLNIASTLYGLLRPFDMIKPYRMEYSLKLPEMGAGNMYAFWRDKLTPIIIENIKKDDGVLINMASMDIQAAFDWKKMEREVRIITPEFKVMKNNGPTTIVIYAKMARGEMSRYIIKNRIKDPEELKAFEWEGFHYSPQMSDENKWVFLQG